jgi:BirA family biotin operon repressor/biotin-[acetyl-CoA-carboxylase] ligase
MVEELAPTFDRAAFHARLATRRLGRELIVRREAESTNDVAWDALSRGSPDGTAVVADLQTRGRGREGRPWHTAPGKGLALSLALHQGCDPQAKGAVPLAAGLALARALEDLGVRGALKWPNDVLVSGKKVSGILCEARRTPLGDDAVVIGVGVNVTQEAGDLPDALRDTATSLALEGVATDRETVAAAFLNAFEPVWIELEEGGPEGVLAAWSQRASFWGAPVSVRTPAGTVRGVARALSPEGGLVLALAGGGETTVLAGDVAPADSATP